MNKVVEKMVTPWARMCELNDVFVDVGYDALVSGSLPEHADELACFMGEFCKCRRESAKLLAAEEVVWIQDTAQREVMRRMNMRQPLGIVIDVVRDKTIAASRYHLPLPKAVELARLEPSFEILVDVSHSDAELTPECGVPAGFVTGYPVPPRLRSAFSAAKAAYECERWYAMCVLLEDLIRVVVSTLRRRALGNSCGGKVVSLAVARELCFESTPDEKAAHSRVRDIQAELHAEVSQATAIGREEAASLLQETVAALDCLSTAFGV